MISEGLCVDNDSLWQRNLLALTTQDPELSGRATRSQEQPRFNYSIARSGYPVPLIELNGRSFPLHSTVDPVREGERFYLSAEKSRGTIIFFGIGAGYHIEPFLSSDEVASLILVEKNIGDFVETLKNIDFRTILLDKRVSLIIGAQPSEIGQKLMQLYLPVLTGDLLTVPLMSLTRFDEDYYRQVTESVKESTNRIKEDHSVQCYFGCRWYHNTLLNLTTAAKSTSMLPPIRNALITAAGPSLESQLPELIKQRAAGFLIATDTSLPFLLESGIKPDCVLSLDCQQISYHHFLKGYPKDVPLILDLASPPGLTRLTEKLIFFTSGHPLSSYINRYWRPFPEIDTSGGNVTHAAVSLAESLNAERITLFGADFCYPEGRPYVRGTYIYSYFQSLADRLSPHDSRVFRFIFRNPVIRERSGESFRYLTLPMIRYREYLEQKALKMVIPLVSAAGAGIPLNFPDKPRYQRPSMLSLFGSGSPVCSLEEFLVRYREDIKGLPDLKKPYIHYFETIQPKEKQVWSTLLPGAAHFLNSGLDSRTALETSGKWSLAQLDMIINKINGL